MDDSKPSSGRSKGERDRSSRPPPSNRVLRPSNSNESLGEMQLDGQARRASTSDPLNASTSSTSHKPRSNRERVANFVAQMNSSNGSIKSEGSLGSNGRRKRSSHSSSKDRKTVDRKGRISRHAGSSNRRSRSSSPTNDDADEESTIVSTASSKRSHHRRSTRRSNRSHRNSSRSRSKSQSRNRSHSVNARKHLAKTMASSSSNTNNSNGRDKDYQNSTGTLNLNESYSGHNRTNRRTRRSSRDDQDPTASPSSLVSPVTPNPKTRRDGAVASPPLSGNSEGRGTTKVSEVELLEFLEHQEEEGDLAPLSSRANGSSRRERTSSGSRGSTDTSPVRRDYTASTSSYARPPRTSRGVGRSQSAATTTSSQGLEALVSPKRNSRTGSRLRNRPNLPADPTRGVRRAKSTDDMGDLSNFFAANSNVSRRKKPMGGARSVASMPSGPNSAPSGQRRRRKGTSVATDKDDASKPSSSRSTETDSYDSGEDDGDESIDESMEDLNDLAPYERSGSGGGGNNSYTNDSSVGALDFMNSVNMEQALQMHMSRTDNLLYDVFPKHIAEALRMGRKVEPENHECVTIFFSDIVGFTNISSELDPLKISDMLDRLYNAFDALSHYHDVFKVETIGDAYMAVTNLTKKQPDHCKRIAEFAVDAIRVANQTLIDKEEPSKGFVNIRVGFHSGPVVSNVVGSRNPRFCLFGDTVNTASRMESNSAPNRIHCSGDSADLLMVQHPKLKLNPRGVIQVKGKGDMHTYWVNEEAAMQSQRNGTSRSIFKMLKRPLRRGSVA
eukprot:Nitzschia sp. Nitz4//scaffold24_size164493//113881//116306//NITZ4_002340-RA/size164493-processed-gene-0.240-mRNA-1//-1//CDS//3329544150//6320//frame0